MAVAASAIAAPAMARDGQGYFGADIGVVVDNEVDVAISGVEDAANIEHEMGWDLGAFLGYDFGFIRTEAEISYKENDPETLTTVAPGVPQFTRVPVTGTFDPVAGELQIVTAMANAMVDIGGNDNIGFSAGVGVGHAWVDANYSTGISASSVGWLDDSDHDWAWQAIAAVRIPVTEQAELGLKYRYLNTKQMELVDQIGRSNAFEIASHSAMVTFIANFGGAEAPPPPPPPVAQCNQGPYIVFFDWDKSDITPEAATILNNAVTAYGNCGTAAIMLAGHTDRSGSTQYNMGLAERRNTSVRNYLTGRGIPAARISSQAFGESMPRVPTADGVRELQNRRVEISYGPGSGR
jgi:outer membrane protein OmpA-like peptidoglycan-associated protein